MENLVGRQAELRAVRIRWDGALAQHESALAEPGRAPAAYERTGERAERAFTLLPGGGDDLAQEAGRSSPVGLRRVGLISLVARRGSEGGS
jgi:hypothetical protein